MLLGLKSFPPDEYVQNPSVWAKTEKDRRGTVWI